MMDSMKKLPWGIFAGICGIVVFFSTVGIIAAFIILSAIAGATSDCTTLFATWYQKTLFAADIIFGVGLILSVTMFVIKKLDNKREREELTNEVKSV